MMRLMTILILLLAGIPRVGIGMIGSPRDTDCNDMVCQPIVVQKETSCCGEPDPVIDMDEFCPMSNGPCRCGVSPTDDHDRKPIDPLQRNESKITLGIFKAPVQICIWTTINDGHSGTMSGLVENLHALRTHAQTQAILGIWTT